jgi:hypothetical protein
MKSCIEYTVDVWIENKNGKLRVEISDFDGRGEDMKETQIKNEMINYMQFLLREFEYVKRFSKIRAKERNRNGRGKGLMRIRG